MNKGKSFADALTSTMGEAKKEIVKKVPAKSSGVAKNEKTLKKEDPSSKKAQVAVKQPKVDASAKKEKTYPKSMSFYQADLDNIREIRNILTPHFDCAITPTLVTRIALELLTTDESKLVKACQKIRDRDGMKS